jgi:phage tail-like protein
MGSWIGRGGGRSAGQPTISGISGSVVFSGGTGSLDLNSGPGMGSGRAGSQPSLDLKSGEGMGSGRAGSQPGDSASGSWTGRGGGRSDSQPEIEEGSLLGTRSDESTKLGENKDQGMKDVSDPEGAYVFALEIAGTEVAHFLECSGLKTTTDVFELQEGGMNSRVHKLPGQTRWENIVLRYGVSSDTTLLEWRNEVLQDEFGEDNRLSGSIIVKNNQMETVRRYDFVEAWPVSWEGPSFSAQSAELAIESLELAHHGITVS